MSEFPSKENQFEKGKGGNPNGRPKGSKNRRTIVREILDMVDKPSGKSNAEAITAALVKKALKGDVNAFKELMDSGFGKNTDVVDQTSTNVNVDVPMTESDEKLLTHFYQTKGKGLINKVKEEMTNE